MMIFLDRKKKSINQSINQSINHVRKQERMSPLLMHKLWRITGTLSLQKLAPVRPTLDFTHRNLRRATVSLFIEHFHVTSLPPCWKAKNNTFSPPWEIRSISCNISPPSAQEITSILSTVRINLSQKNSHARYWLCSFRRTSFSILNFHIYSLSTDSIAQ